MSTATQHNEHMVGQDEEDGIYHLIAHLNETIATVLSIPQLSCRERKAI